jgi:hypothetical protein
MKTYWLLQNIWSDSECDYLAFETHDTALQYAEDNGAFEQCHGKEMWCDQYDRMIHEVREDELEHFTPFEFVPNKEKAV